MAAQMLAVAIAWQVYDLTDSAFDLGLVGLIQFVPVVLLGLLIGHVADRYDRRRIVLICEIAQAGAAAALAFGSAAGWLSTDAIFALVFVSGTARAFESPTAQALLPELVPQRLIPPAVAGSTSINQTAVVVGPALGGLLYVAGPTAVYACCCAGFLLAGAMMILIRAELPAPERKPVSLATLLAGLTYIRGHRVLLGLISLDLFAVLLGGATALLPIYARDILSTGPWGLGLLRGAPALGAVAMSVYLARYPLRRAVGRLMFAAVATFGVATVAFALSTSFALSLATLVVVGASDCMSMVIRGSLTQIETPNQMRGRVSTINSMFIGTSNRLGEFRAGATAAWIGTVPAVLVGGIGTMLVVLIWMRLFPTISRIDSLDRTG
jgi:MFS family permease